MPVVTDEDWYDDGDCEYAVKGLGIWDTVGVGTDFTSSAL